MKGRLKIFLGYAAGVGKTFQMLTEAHELKDRGVDITQEPTQQQAAPQARPQAAQQPNQVNGQAPGDGLPPTHTAN